MFEEKRRKTKKSIPKVVRTIWKNEYNVQQNLLRNHFTHIMPGWKHTAPKCTYTNTFYLCQQKLYFSYFSYFSSLFHRKADTFQHQVFCLLFRRNTRHKRTTKQTEQNKMKWNKTQRHSVKNQKQNTTRKIRNNLDDPQALWVTNCYKNHEAHQFYEIRVMCFLCALFLFVRHQFLHQRNNIE